MSLLAGAAGWLLSGCSDDESGEPQYRTTEELHVATSHMFYPGSTSIHGIHGYIYLTFYGSQDFVLSLLNSRFEVHSTGEERFSMIDDSSFEQNAPRPWVESYLLTHILRVPNPYPLPDFEWPYYSFSVYLSVPEVNGDYDLYFSFTNPEKGIYLQTPPCELTLSVPEGEGDQVYVSSIVMKNR